MSGQRPWDGAGIALLAFTLIACVYPPLFAMYRDGFSVYAYPFASDVFYYARIARESHLWFYTYDGVHATNGFHPLWQVLLTAIDGVVRDPAILIHTMGILSIALVTLGTVILAFAVRRLTGSAVLAMFLVPGLYYVLFAVDVLQNATWSYMNGMESPLTVVLGALLIREAVLLWQDPTRLDAKGTYPRLAALATLIVMARLDDVFLLVGIGLAVLLTFDRRIILRALPWAALPVVVILAYVSFNHWYAGMWLPVSGELKGGAPVVYNLKKFIYNAFPPVELLTAAMNWRIDQRLNMVTYFNLRILQATVPLLVGLAVLALFWPKRGTETWLRGALFAGFAIYMVLKGLYNVFGANITQQGEWYFPLSVMLTNVFAIWAIAIAWRRVAGLAEAQRFSRAPTAAMGVAALVLFLMSTGQYLERSVGTKSAEQPELALWNDREQVARELAAIDPDMGLIEMENGFIAFALPNPVINGKLWVIDKEAVEAFKAGRFLTLAYERGLDTITSTYHGPWGRIYLEAPGRYGEHFDLGDPTRAMRQFLERKFPDAANFEFELIYTHKPSGTYFVRMTPVRAPDQPVTTPEAEPHVSAVDG
jgi:hypothetical protein